MWNKKTKKMIFTLNLNPDEYKNITDLTFPLLKNYAYKIGADFYEISERKFPEWESPTYEKCQIYQLAQHFNNDWNIYIDADCLVHPDTPDITELIPKNTVLHNGSDFAPLRWKYDRFFQRDGRHIGSPSWLCIASDLCIELFKPVDDLTPEEAYQNIFPLYGELANGYEPYRLIEDYIFSRNIAKYGLKFKTFLEMGIYGDYFYHEYMKPIEQKEILLKNILKSWNILNESSILI